jgi:hypothetical protein
MARNLSLTKRLFIHSTIQFEALPRDEVASVNLETLTENNINFPLAIQLAIASITKLHLWVT